ncbi:leucine-rich repeat domain-containing protein [Collinsella tanakaei]|uniref:leucine-rich repeat domain-containing protein n=1 Tax=Collinsella tanakaei TaxID=626935 RepID=UPI001F2D4605|nr:leucine-rich repeat domain-containing protein [Collinsella tanakaei]MCF2622303.1 hypothetical protein [Collinsella tanakaei]
MAVGTIQKSVFTDIANAIRVQNGGTGTYLPSEMAAAVLALDGIQAGTPYQAVAATGTGVISDSVFDAIADAIRAQNGLAETYKPSEMAPAILALSWDTGVKIRALLLSDGTLEFNYRDGRSSSVPGAVILKAWEVDPEGYSSAGSRPWDDDKLSVTRAVIDEDMGGSALASAAYLFHGCENLVEVEGFGHLTSPTNMNQMFVSCASLETIWADSFYGSVESGTLMFSGCRRLVGERGYVPEQTDDHLNLHFESSGVLTHPDESEDEREWFRCFLYADGELVLTAATAPETGRELVSSGRLCANARYNSVGYQPWYDHRDDVEAVEIAADMATYGHVNTNYWFYGHQSITDVTGVGNLHGVREMQHTFNSCTGLTEIDLSGLDPSSLEDLAYTFGGCASLVTIWADADWALPTSGVSGFQTFYQCTSLVGGAGTTYASSRAGYQYMRIDGVGGAGYLTAKSS